jgi:hypothetical protein
MVLVRYRDAGMATYTWFYVNEKQHPVSPFFDTEKQAQDWFNRVFDGEEEVVIAV